MIDCKPLGDDGGWRFESEEFAADWRGFLFVAGHRAGEDGVASARIADEMTAAPISAYAFHLIAAVPPRSAPKSYDRG